MAQSAEDIYNEMVAESQTYDQLSALMPQYNLIGPTPDNPFKLLLADISLASVVGVWRLMMYIVANAMHNLQVLWDNFLIQLNLVVANSYAGTTPWYASVMFDWQYGYGLLWNASNRRYYYADTTSSAAVASRLVFKSAADEVVSQNFSGVLIKVAKNTGTAAAPVLAPLDNTPGTELDSITTYLRLIGFAGTERSVISIAPDIGKLNLNVYYDGTLDLATFQTTLLAAINTFQTSFNINNFNGIFYINDLIDTIRAVPGVKLQGCDVLGVQCRPNAGSFADVIESYNPAAGYMVLQPVGTNPLTDTVINYIES